MTPLRPVLYYRFDFIQLGLLTFHYNLPFAKSARNVGLKRPSEMSKKLMISPMMHCVSHHPPTTDKTDIAFSSAILQILDSVVGE